MPTGRNPDLMTTNERRDEIARILAAGMLRSSAMRYARRSESADSNDSAEIGFSRLDLCANSPLSVAPRPPQ